MPFPGPTPLLVPNWMAGLLAGSGRVSGASFGVWGLAPLVVGLPSHGVTGEQIFAMSEAAGLVNHVDKRIGKLETLVGGGTPDPNDPNERYRKGWLKELRAAVKNLHQVLKRLPNNKLRRGPAEQAIQRAESAIQKYGGR